LSGDFIFPGLTPPRPAPKGKPSGLPSVVRLNTFGVLDYIAFHYHLPVSSNQSTDRQSISISVQKLAGWVFLNCAQLEEALKLLLAAMATAQAGQLTPADAQPILDGTSKLTSGMAYREILKYIDISKNWNAYVEPALQARNQLVHGYRFSRWAKITTADDLRQLESELKPLVLQVQQGVGMIRPMIKAVLRIILEQYPDLKTEEWQRIADSEPRIEIVTSTTCDADKL
jgi:hypothetical protein